MQRYFYPAPQSSLHCPWLYLHVHYVVYAARNCISFRTWPWSLRKCQVIIMPTLIAISMGPTWGAPGPNIAIWVSICRLCKSPGHRYLIYLVKTLAGLWPQRESILTNRDFDISIYGLLPHVLFHEPVNYVKAVFWQRGFEHLLLKLLKIRQAVFQIGHW